MKLKELITALCTKTNKKSIEHNINIDYHLERDGNIYQHERPFMYPTDYVCNFDERLQTGVSIEDHVLSCGWIKASNRFPKKLKKDKKILPEYIAMIILTAIISLPYSICAGLIYILRRGHAYITRSIRDEKYRNKHFPVKRFFKKILKIFTYGIIMFLINIFLLNNVLGLKNGWTQFCLAAHNSDLNYSNIILGCIFIIATGLIVLIFINKIVIPTFFFAPKKTLMSKAVDFIMNVFPDEIGFTSTFKTDAIAEKRKLLKEPNCCGFSSLYIPFNESALSKELHYYRKHAYVGELTWRFISPFAYRYYCMAYGYYIPITLITKRSPIPYNIFYKANPYAQKSKPAKYFTNL